MWDQPHHFCVLARLRFGSERTKKKKFSRTTLEADLNITSKGNLVQLDAVQIQLEVCVNASYGAG